MCDHLRLSREDGRAAEHAVSVNVCVAYCTACNHRPEGVAAMRQALATAAGLMRGPARNCVVLVLVSGVELFLSSLLSEVVSPSPASSTQSGPQWMGGLAPDEGVRGT